MISIATAILIIIIAYIYNTMALNGPPSPVRSGISSRRRPYFRRPRAVIAAPPDWRNNNFSTFYPNLPEPEISVNPRYSNLDESSSSEEEQRDTEPTILAPPLPHSSPADAAAIFQIFHQGLKLPAEIADIILDIAEIWQVQKIHLTQTYIIRADSSDVTRGREYISLQVGIETRKLRRIVWRIIGQDQGKCSLPSECSSACYLTLLLLSRIGWSSNDPIDKGTYRSSHSWYEASVYAPAWSDMPDGEKDKALHEPVEINRNIHASSQLRLYQNCWDFNHPDEEVRSWMGAVKKGCVIGIQPCAQYPGWQAHMEGAEIWVFGAL